MSSLAEYDIEIKHTTEKDNGPARYPSGQEPHTEPLIVAGNEKDLHDVANYLIKNRLQQN